jgi:endonuclease YncB( thermonuclease family)
MPRIGNWRKLRRRSPAGTLAALAAIALVALAASLLGPGYAPVSGAARASDGDSLRLGGERVRLLDIDAPELDQTCRTGAGADWPCGAAARDAMARLLASGKVACQPRDRDRYGRLLAHCDVAGRDLGAAMVALGLALASGGYYAEEREAREASRGIWQGDFTTPREWREGRDDASLWNWLTNLVR